MQCSFNILYTETNCIVFKCFILHSNTFKFLSIPQSLVTSTRCEFFKLTIQRRSWTLKFNNVEHNQDGGSYASLFLSPSGWKQNFQFANLYNISRVLALHQIARHCCSSAVVVVVVFSSFHQTIKTRMHPLARGCPSLFLMPILSPVESLDKLSVGLAGTLETTRNTSLFRILASRSGDSSRFDKCKKRVGSFFFFLFSFFVSEHRIVQGKFNSLRMELFINLFDSLKMEFSIRSVTKIFSDATRLRNFNRFVK